MGDRAVGLDQLNDGAREEAAVRNHVARQTQPLDESRECT
jgi:hypothetical protein